MYHGNFDVFSDVSFLPKGLKNQTVYRIYKAHIEQQKGLQTKLQNFQQKKTYFKIVSPPPVLHTVLYTKTVSPSSDPT